MKLKTVESISNNTYTYDKSNPICEGGNGKIFAITSICNQPAKDECVIKLLVNKKRFERFKKEINFLETHKDIDGIFPITDRDKDYKWYIMPKAIPYKDIATSLNLEVKLNDLLRLASTIQSLHQINGCHRDIKPDNLLYHNNKIYLSDFGLILEEDNHNITQEFEKVGPQTILPPELLSYKVGAKIDYKKSDVYLFAKTLWIIIFDLKSYGFQGPYSRNNCYTLSADELKTNCIEPLHLLMYKATKDDYQDRITISQCIEYIKEQLLIISGAMSTDRLKQYQYNESINNIVASTSPKARIYTDYKTIIDVILSIKEKCACRIINNQFSFEIKDIIYLQNGNFKITTFIANKPLNLYLSIPELIIGKDNRVTFKARPHNSNISNTKELFEYLRYPIGIYNLCIANECIFEFTRL